MHYSYNAKLYNEVILECITPPAKKIYYESKQYKTMQRLSHSKLRSGYNRILTVPVCEGKTPFDYTSSEGKVVVTLGCILS